MSNDHPSGIPNYKVGLVAYFQSATGLVVPPTLRDKLLAEVPEDKVQLLAEVGLMMAAAIYAMSSDEDRQTLSPTSALLKLALAADAGEVLAAAVKATGKGDA